MATTTNDVLSGLVDLASADLGGKVLGCTDEWFAEADNLIKRGRGVFLPDEYTDRGKWMDGWESRRRRGGPDHDYAILSLGASGKIRAFDIDTNHFLGNHPPIGAVDAIVADRDTKYGELQDADWTEILPQSPLKLGSQNVFVCSSDQAWTHVRLRIYPDGGVARFRVWGEVEDSPRVIDEPDTVSQLRDGEWDLAALHNGGMTMACSDMFFSPMTNLILPFPAGNMGEGWETRRKRHAGHDWIIVKLAKRGTIRLPVVDTHFFKGNYPESFSLETIDDPDVTLAELTWGPLPWQPLVARTKLGPDERRFVDGLQHTSPVTHVRLNIYPDGGISRLRLYGSPA